MTNKKGKKFLQDESEFEGHFDKNLWQDLRRFWQAYLPLALLSLSIGACGRFALLSISVVIGTWADGLCPGSELCNKNNPLFLLPTHLDYLLLAGGLLAFGGMFSGVYLISIASLGAKVTELIHNETVMHVSRYPMNILDRTPIGNIYTRFSSDFNSVLMANGPHLAQIGMISLDITIMLALITWIDYRLLFLCLPFLAFNAYIYRRNAIKVRNLRRRAASARSPSIAHFSSTIKGFLSIDMFGKRKAFLDRFDRLVHSYYFEKSRADFTFYLFGLKISISTAFLMLALSIVSIYLISINELTVGSAGIVISYIAIIASFIQRLFTLITSLEQGLTGAERIHEYIRKPLEDYALLPASTILNDKDEFERSGVRIVSEDNAKIEIRNIWFRYNKSGPWILKDLSLDVARGKSVGIIGRTGSGKSSLFQVLLQLYAFDKGSIEVDGQSIGDVTRTDRKELSLTDWRNYFSFITQEPRIFRATIRENLDPKGEFTEDNLIDITERVGLSEWIQRFPDKFDTQLAEDGGDMSSGQRQQLATARCLLRNSPIVLMDEATSAVDPQSEEFFLKATRELLSNKTRLIIAHRLSTVLDCDYVAWLKDGKIHKYGTPEEVVSDFKQSSGENYID